MFGEKTLPDSPPLPDCVCCRQPADGPDIWGKPFCAPCGGAAMKAMPVASELAASAPDADVLREHPPGQFMPGWRELKPGAHERLSLAWLRGWVMTARKARAA